MTMLHFRGLLLTLDIPVYHFEAPAVEGRYIVWEESGTSGYHADGVRKNKVHSVRVHFFTQTEFDPMIDAIEATLQMAGVPFDGPVSMYEYATHYYHHVFDCDVVSCG